MSSDCKYLASGDAEGFIFIWDLESRQAIRTINNSSSSSSSSSKGGGPVTNLSFWLNDPELLKGGGGVKSKKPTIVFPDVPKLIEGNNDDDGGE
jgi:WD40 repeat protein